LIQLSVDGVLVPVTENEDACPTGRLVCDGVGEGVAEGVGVVVGEVDGLDEGEAVGEGSVVMSLEEELLFFPKQPPIEADTNAAKIPNIPARRIFIMFAVRPVFDFPQDVSVETFVIRYFGRSILGYSSTYASPRQP
jgi:hypothetical protein